MNSTRETRITRCSLVVAFADIWTARTPVQGDLSVYIENSGRRPVRKSDGSYVFLDLEQKPFVLTVRSAIYLPVRLEVDPCRLESLAPVVTVPLLPTLAYPYARGATGLWTSLIDAEGRPLPDTNVVAFASDISSFRAKLVEEHQEGSRCVRIGSLKGRAVRGETFLLQDSRGEELIRATGITTGGIMHLEQPLGRSYARGASLLPAVETRSAADGTVVLPFRGSLPETFSVAVRFGEEPERTANWTALRGELKRLPDMRL